MSWKADPEVTAARKALGWVEFHRAAGRIGAYFDQMEKSGRREYRCDAFTVRRHGGGFRSELLATGRGATVIQAVADAYGACGRSSPDADAALAVLLRGPVVEPVDDFEALLGEPDEFEELLG